MAKQSASADWYKQNMPSKIADQQSTELGISKDQLYQMYATYAAQGQGGPGSAADWSQRSFLTQGGPGQSNYSQNQQIAPSSAYNWIQGQVNTQQGQQVLNPPQQQQTAQQPQMPQLGQAQPRPAQIPITPLSATPQFGSATQNAAPVMNVPQANAGATSPLFSLGGGGQQNWMLPQAQMQPPQQQQPIQMFQGGGPVTSQNQQNQPDQGYQTGTSDPGAQTGWYNPLYGLGALGAASTWSPLVVNPTPSGTPSSKSGVATVGQPTVYQMPPGGGQMSWGQLAQTAGFSASDIANFQQQGLSPVQVAQQYNVGNPAQTMPGVFNKAPTPTLPGPMTWNQVGQAAGLGQGDINAFKAQGLSPDQIAARFNVKPPTAGWTGASYMPLTAQAPANAAQMPQMQITPAANAGAAAGANIAAAQGPNTDRVPAMLTPGEFVMNRQATQLFGPQLAQMNQMAGQPPPAPGQAPSMPAQGPAPYTGTVHTDPFMSHAVSTLMGFATNPWHNPDGSPGRANTALATAPTPSKKMQSGGLVTPNWDQQGQVQRFQGGGSVWNPLQPAPLQPETELAPITVTGTPPQRPRQITVPQQQAAPPQQQPSATQMPQPQPQYYQNFGYGSGYPGSYRPSPTPAQSTPEQAAWRAGAGGSSSTLTGFSGQPIMPATPGGGVDYRNTPYDPDPDTPYLKAAGTTGMGAHIQAAGSAVASGLQQAASAIASSVHPWQMQQSAIPSPSSFQNRYQTPSLQPERTA